MSEVRILWDDGVNPSWEDEVNVDPSIGVNDTTVSVSGGVNDKLDRSGKIKVQSDDAPELVEEVVVKQKGERIAFCTGDGVPFLTGDGASINVLKSNIDV